MLVEGGEHLVAVAGLGDHLDALLGREHQPQARTQQRIVIDEQDADRAHGVHGSSARSTKFPCLVRPAHELAAGELDALGQADEAGAGPRQPVAAARRRAMADELEHQRRSAGGVQRHVD